MTNRIVIAILVVLVTCSICLGQSAFKGLQPGRSTRVDVERGLGKPLREISETLSEYKSDKETEKIFVQYRRESDVIERIELVYPETLPRPDVVQMFKLPQATTAAQANAQGRLEEYYGSPWFLVLTYGDAAQCLNIVRIGYYSRELFDSAVAKVPPSQPGLYKVPTLVPSPAQASQRQVVNPSPQASSSPTTANDSGKSTGAVTRTSSSATSDTSQRTTSVLPVLPPGGDTEAEIAMSEDELRRLVGRYQVVSTPELDWKEAVVELSGDNLRWTAGTVKQTLIPFSQSSV